MFIDYKKRIEELEAENRIFRATESVDDTVWDALLEQIRSHQSRIEAGLKLADEWSMAAHSMPHTEDMLLTFNHAGKLRKALGADDE